MRPPPPMLAGLSLGCSAVVWARATKAEAPTTGRSSNSRLREIVPICSSSKRFAIQPPFGTASFGGGPDCLSDADQRPVKRDDEQEQQRIHRAHQQAQPQYVLGSKVSVRVADDQHARLVHKNFTA